MSDPFPPLRDALAAARKRQRLYPHDLRDSVVRLALSLGASAASCSPLAKRLGLPPATLRYWLETSAPPLSFLPVVLRSSQPAQASLLTLVLPGGARVEGLSLDDLASLCRKVAS